MILNSDDDSLGGSGSPVRSTIKPMTSDAGEDAEDVTGSLFDLPPLAAIIYERKRGENLLTSKETNKLA